MYDEQAELEATMRGKPVMRHWTKSGRAREPPASTSAARTPQRGLSDAGSDEPGRNAKPRVSSRRKDYEDSMADFGEWDAEAGGFGPSWDFERLVRDEAKEKRRELDMVQDALAGVQSDDDSDAGSKTRSRRRALANPGEDDDGGDQEAGAAPERLARRRNDRHPELSDSEHHADDSEGTDHAGLADDPDSASSSSSPPPRLLRAREPSGVGEAGTEVEGSRAGRRGVGPKVTSGGEVRGRKVRSFFLFLSRQ